MRVFAQCSSWDPQAASAENLLNNMEYTLILPNLYNIFTKEKPIFWDRIISTVFGKCRFCHVALKLPGGEAEGGQGMILYLFYIILAIYLFGFL